MLIFNSIFSQITKDIFIYSKICDTDNIVISPRREYYII